MKIRHLLVAASIAATAIDAMAFEWDPAIQQPNPYMDVTQTYQLESLRIATVSNLTATDVMPKWIDEDGNEIVGAYSSSSNPSWGDYVYEFSFSEFKANGEYVLEFPKGMLKNAAGELSDAKSFYYTVNIEQLSAGMFDDFKVLSVSPDLSQPQAIWDAQKVVVNTNHNEAIGLTTLQVIDQTDGESIFISRNNNLENQRGVGNASEISWEVVGNFKFYEGHEYKAEFVFYNGVDEVNEDGIPTKVVDRVSYTFTGRVEGYKYSSETLVSITPAPYTLTISEPSQAVFTYTFSGPVNVYKALTAQGLFGTTEYPESCLSSNEDKTIWTLNISDQEYLKTVDADLSISIYARDLEGFQLKGNFGEESGSCFEYGWKCDIGAKAIAVVSPESGQSLDRLSEIVVKSESGEAMKWSWVGEAYIQNLLGENIGKLSLSEEENPVEATEFHFSKWVPEGDGSAVPLDIVAEGSYVIYFGPGCFVFGEEFNSKNSRSLYSGFQITGALDEKPDDPVVDPAEQEVLNFTSVDPESGSVVESLDVIKVSFPEDINLDGCDVLVYSANQQLVTTGVGDLDWDNWAFDYVLVKLTEPVTEPGRYQVVIPARSICNDAFAFSDGKEGICNPEIRLYYTIEESDDPLDPAEQAVFVYESVTPESGSTITSLEYLQLKYPEVPGVMEFSVNVYKEGADAPVAKADIEYNWDDWYVLDVKFTEHISEAGVYTIVFPRGIIGDDLYCESNGAKGICNPEFKLVYTVDPTGGSAVGSVAASGVADVFDVHGRLVLRDASSADIKTLPKGIYVVGSRKIVVK